MTSKEYFDIPIKELLAELVLALTPPHGRNNRYDRIVKELFGKKTKYNVHEIGRREDCNLYNIVADVWKKFNPTLACREAAFRKVFKDRYIPLSQEWPDGYSPQDKNNVLTIQKRLLRLYDSNQKIFENKNPMWLLYIGYDREEFDADGGEHLRKDVLEHWFKKYFPRGML
jgi:hypothetical protein